METSRGFLLVKPSQIEQTKEKRQPPRSSSNTHPTQVPQTLFESHKPQLAVDN